MNNTFEIGKKLVDFCKQGKDLEAIETLDSPNIVSVEAVADPRFPQRMDGIAAIKSAVGHPEMMAKHVPDAGSYAPVTILVDERKDGVHLSYDRMASLLATYGNADALAVARDLDSKIEKLIRESAA